MSQLLGPRNAVHYALFNAKGGMRGHAILAGAIFVGLSLLMAVTAQLSGVDWARTLWGWSQFMLVIQAMVVSIIAIQSVANTIRNDAKSGMHESLRLMRASPAAVIFGYITGASTQAFAFYLPCFLAGAIASFVSGKVGIPFVWASMLLLSSAVFLVVIAATLSFISKIPVLPIVLTMLFVPVCFALSSVVPALTLIAGPIAGGGALNLQRTSVEPMLVLSMLAQASVAGVFFLAAARKFRDPGMPAFDADLGLALVALWSAIGMVAMRFWFDLAPRLFTSNKLGISQVSGELIPQLLIGLLPCVAAARSSGLAWKRRREEELLGDVAEPPSNVRSQIRFGLPTTLILATVLAVVPVVAGYEVMRANAFVWQAVGLIVIAFPVFFFTISMFARRAYATTRFGGILVIVFTGLLLGAAPLLQSMISAASSNNFFADHLHVIQFSAPGTVIFAWLTNKLDINITANQLLAGLGFQGGFAVVIAILCRLPRGMMPRRTEVPPPTITRNT